MRVRDGRAGPMANLPGGGVPNAVPPRELRERGGPGQDKRFRFRGGGDAARKYGFIRERVSSELGKHQSGPGHGFRPPKVTAAAATSRSRRPRNDDILEPFTTKGRALSANGRTSTNQKGRTVPGGPGNTSKYFGRPAEPYDRVSRRGYGPPPPIAPSGIRQAAVHPGGPPSFFSKNFGFRTCR